jgi:hypothetical protein
MVNAIWLRRRNRVFGWMLLGVCGGLFGLSLLGILVLE